MLFSKSSPHITPEEWRWVIIVSGILVTITLLPYAWALASNNANPDVQFMGILANPKDGSTYLAKMEQGYRGDLTFHLAFTPEPHEGTALFLFYILLGHLAKLIGQSPVVVFHICRVLAGLFMYFALYQLGATVWTHRRPRRFFFALTAVGSGLGWLLIVVASDALDITTNRLLPDLNMPEAFPLYAVYTNPHFPLAIGLLALVASIYLQVFRPGVHEEPTVYNQGLILILASITLAFVLPQAIAPISATLFAYLVVRAVRTRRFPFYETSWCIALWFPAAPVLLYDFAVTRVNPAIENWNAQNVTLSPPPHYYLVGFAPFIVLAIPGIWRAVRNFEPDGDQLMLTWLIVNVVLLYSPFNIQRRFVVGLILPLTYFAVRGIQDWWVNVLPQRSWRPLVIFLFVVLLPSHALAMGAPLLGVVADTDFGLEHNLVLEKDYVDTLGWIRNNVPLETDDRPTVILASPNISPFIPAWTGHRVVYGHEFETIDAEEKLDRVTAWYQGEGCRDLLQGDTWENRQWQVDYVIVGPSERALGEDAGTANPSACYEQPDILGEPVGVFGDVVLYRVR